MKYVDPKFSSRPATAEYREGWERTFAAIHLYRFNGTACGVSTDDAPLAISLTKVTCQNCRATNPPENCPTCGVIPGHCALPLDGCRDAWHGKPRRAKKR